MRQIILSAALLVQAAPGLAAEAPRLQLDSLFQDHMVLPRQGAVVSGSAGAREHITVSGFGIANSQIEVKLVPLGAGTATGVLATTTVAPNGSWVTAVTIPTLTLGNWKVVANAVGCTGTGSATVQVV